MNHNINPSKFLDQVIYCPNCFNALVKFSPEVNRSEDGLETVNFIAQQTLQLENNGMDVKCGTCGKVSNLYQEIERL